MHLSQLHTILWLRWRLTRNQWSRSGRLNAIVTLVIMATLSFVGLIGGLVGLLFGVFVFRRSTPHLLLAVWDGTVGAFLLFWCVGIISELQRSEAIDIGKMLHLPVSMKGIFLLNYLASHVTASVVFFVPWMIGLSIGLAVGRGPAMLWMVPLSLAFVFMLTAWTYHLRGWLLTLMQNPRRYRMIVGTIGLGVLLLSQLPNLIFMARDKHRARPDARQRSSEETEKDTELHRHREERALSTFLWAHNVAPPLWVGNGVMHLADGGAWSAALGTAGSLALAGLGLSRAYRSTRRFYEGRSIKARARRKQVALKDRTLLERTLPGVPDEAAAMALAFFRSMTRATEVRMTVASNLLWLVIFGGMIFVRRAASPGTDMLPFIAAGAVALPFFGMSQLLLNQFGFDRTGFRVLVLSPVPRWQILLGKNLAVLPFMAGIGLILLLVAAVGLHVPALVVLAACLQFLIAFLLSSMYGNLISPLLPCRVAPGSLKPTKLPATTMILLICCHVFASMMLVPVFLPPLAGYLFASAGWLPAAPMNLLFSAIELPLLAVLYALSLPHLGNLLQHREKRILEVVTKEVE
ncbi:MAG: hypothetical protein JW955_19205 [Sedimentisphaerales bacterium]|nr:hypothetical protein [Sedimentisphaerales bacterium]